MSEKKKLFTAYNKKNKKKKKKLYVIITNPVERNELFITKWSFLFCGGWEFTVMGRIPTMTWYFLKKGRVAWIMAKIDDIWGIFSIGLTENSFDF